MLARRFSKVLIANRAEIAARVIRTCHTMGLSTVAIFSDADRHAPHVSLADQAVHIGPAPSRLSYLDIARVIDAARLTGADAIHPGYGFLAENADFAQACQDADIVFIGPSPDAIRAMGSKIEAKRRVVEAGVPVVPGYNGDNQDLDVLRREAISVGFPLLIKASAGGGGKGMRVVYKAEQLDEGFSAAKREALSAFGDDALMIEKYIEDPRHIEFQILGDHHGNLIHLFERECSIQRRHQKIIEETPSVALSDDLRARMGEAAVAVGRAIGYQNAGTVEFILSPEGDFYFLEVNTRLQVEHPVTEMITGIDLVREQVRVAQGNPLSFGQLEVSTQGAAVECRLYAEDPSAGFLPSTGILTDWHLPEMDGLRVDSGVRIGDAITVHYDPMLAKLITWAPTRDEATSKMVRALRSLSVHGIKNNRQFLIEVLNHPEYRAGNLTTHFIDEHLAHALKPSTTDLETLRSAAVAATLIGFEQRRLSQQCLPHITPGFRNNPVRDQHSTWIVEDQTVDVYYRTSDEATLEVRFDADSPYQAVTLRSWASPTLCIEDDHGVVRTYRAISGDHGSVWLHNHDDAFALQRSPRFPVRGTEEVAGGCTAPMPGQVIQVAVTSGQTVKKGELLVILEAMKMEHSVKAPADGVVAQVAVQVGDQVDVDALLVILDDEEASGEGTDTAESSS